MRHRLQYFMREFGATLLIPILIFTVNNSALNGVLGLCINFIVSKNFKASASLGIAIFPTILFSLIFTRGIFLFVPQLTGNEFLKKVVFILIMAIFVQLLEKVIQKIAPIWYNKRGIYLILIPAISVICGVHRVSYDLNYSLVLGMSYTLGASLGFVFHIIVLASIREKLYHNKVPKPLKRFHGLGIAIITEILIRLLFLGFAGIGKI